MKMKGTTNAQKSNKHPIPDYANAYVWVSSGWTTQRTVPNDGYLSVYVNGSNKIDLDINGNGMIELNGQGSNTSARYPPTPVKKGDTIKGTGTPSDFNILFIPIRWIGGGIKRLSALLRKIDRPLLAQGVC